MKENNDSLCEQNNNEKLLLRITYEEGHIFIAIIFRLVGILIGGVVCLFDQYIISLVGCLVLVLFLISLIDIMFFNELLLYPSKVIKRWHMFGNIEISTTLLNVAKVNNSFYGGGTIVFYGSKNIFLQRLFFQFDVMALGRDTVKKLKYTLIDMNILKGDEHGWYD